MIHPTAIVSPHAHLGTGVIVGPYSIVYDNVVIGDNCDIGSHCEIGYPSVRVNGRPLEIGSGSRVRSHSVLYEGSTLGAGLVTGHRVTVREGTQAGINLQIGTLGDIQGECRIGNHVRFHSGVFVCQNSLIADFVWLFPHVVLTEDPHPPSETRLGVTLDEYAAVAAGSVILPGVRIGRGALVGAMSSVSRDVAPDTVVAGAPAKVIGHAADIKLRDGSGQPAYPWRRHFHRGYPDAVVERWLNEFGLDKTPPNEHQA